MIPNLNILTISQLNFYVKSLLDNDKNLNSIFLIGEISNLTNHYQSGHLYFSLKDEKSTIKAVVFSWLSKNLKFKPENGMKVIVRGRVSIYESTGGYQIYVEDMQPDGVGAQNLAFEQLKNKLFKEGLFDSKRKKSLPSYPKKVGVITSRTGAVFWDIQNVLNRRYPLLEILFYPVLVQGMEAPKQIADAIKFLNEKTDADVLIVGRGGGSAEDLSAFNDELVARAVADSKIPIVSAVGHETDYTICDMVADLRAPTPSAAAELISPDINELNIEINNIKAYMQKLVNKKLLSCFDKLNLLTSYIKRYEKNELIDKRKLKVKVLIGKLNIDFLKIFNENNNKFLKLNSKLDELSPLRILHSGYSATTKGDKFIKSVNDVSMKDEIKVGLIDGSLICNVKKIIKESGFINEKK